MPQTSRSQVALSIKEPDRKFSPAQSARSGQRLYDNHRIYENRKNSLREQRDQVIRSQMKDRPTICQKSSNIVGLKMRIGKNGTHEAPAFVHNHLNCYISSKEKEEEE